MSRQKPNGVSQMNLLTGYQTKFVGADVTRVDALSGLVLSVDKPPAEDAEQSKAWLEPGLDRVDADVRVTDDADGFKNSYRFLIP